MREPAQRPERGPRSYAFPETGENLRAWREQDARLRDAHAYWLATVNPDGEPHVRPVWGVWVEGSLWFDGHPATRWARNLARVPRAHVHLENARSVLIVEGDVEDVEHADDDVGAQIVAARTAKYGRLVPDPVGRGMFRLVPTRARGWSEDLRDGTVWEFATA